MDWPCAGAAKAAVMATSAANVNGCSPWGIAILLRRSGIHATIAPSTARIERPRAGKDCDTGLSRQSRLDALRIERQVADALAGCGRKGIGDRRHRRSLRGFARAQRAF